MVRSSIISVVVLVVIPLLTQAAPIKHVRSKRQSSSLDEALGSAVTEVDRQNLLTDDQFVFDFVKVNKGILNGTGGHINLATANNFPAAIGHGISMALVYLGPCGLDGPVYHSRATEFDYVVTGTFRIGFYQELGGRLVTNIVQPGQAMLIPQGAMHFLQNLNCTQSVLVAALSSADPGLQAVANAFLVQLPSDVIAASIGVDQTTIENLQGSLSSFPELGVEECRQRCGLT